MIRVLAAAMVDLAAVLLPERLRHWGEAMRCEVAEIAQPVEALQFAANCLWGAAAEAARVQLGDEAMTSGRRLIGICAVAATGLGIGYMVMGAAPLGYPLRNLAALVIGFLAVGIVSHVPRIRGLTTGPVTLTLGLALLATTIFGQTVEGATRWVALGGLSIQPSLMLVPVLAIAFAATRDLLATLGVIAAALALALQPDRAMAGALAAAIATVAILAPGRNAALAGGVAVAGFAATMLQPDVQPAMPFVDRILFTAFDIHLLAGLIVVGGSLLLLVPALIGWRRDPANRPAYAAFGALWLAIVLAAALGNYPTPLVGYGGSAIVGYVLGMLGLPRAGIAVARDDLGAAGSADGPGVELRFSV